MPLFLSLSGSSAKWQQRAAIMAVPASALPVKWCFLLTSTLILPQEEISKRVKNGFQKGDFGQFPRRINHRSPISDMTFAWRWSAESTSVECFGSKTQVTPAGIVRVYGHVGRRHEDNVYPHWFSKPRFYKMKEKCQGQMFPKPGCSQTNPWPEEFKHRQREGQLNTHMLMKTRHFWLPV